MQELARLRHELFRNRRTRISPGSAQLYYDLQTLVGGAKFAWATKGSWLCGPLFVARTNPAAPAFVLVAIRKALYATVQRIKSVRHSTEINAGKEYAV